MKKIIAVLTGLLFAVSVFAGEAVSTKAGGAPEKVTKTASVKKVKKHIKKKATTPAVVATPAAK